nr:reverse transcriptase domain-containing protein [Tanacetum cinerariifolium]
EEYAQEILGFSSNSSGGNPTLTFEPILSDSSPSLTPFEGSDFILEEINAYLKDESVLLKINHVDCDPEGDICLIEKLLNNEPFQLPPIDLSGGNPTLTFEPILSDSSPSLTPFEGSDFILEEINAYLKDESVLLKIDHVDCDPEGDICLIEKLLNNEPFQLPPIDLKQGEEIKAKSSIEEPSELELKKLLSHLEYAYLEGVDKLPGIDPRFCTHKILMEEDYKPVVQSQRRVNAKIHEVIKKEVIKLLDAGMIYPISDSPWVSPIHCVPKKGGITIDENENNKRIPTRLVTRWRVCIDYRKLNDATRKDQFPLPFMDQMLERLAGNEFYYFLDGFFSYFQIPINTPDQEKTTFTCPYGTFSYRGMPFGLCNAPEIF